MKKIINYLSFCFLLVASNVAFCDDGGIKNRKFSNEKYQFEWDFYTDKAQMLQVNNQSVIWQGSLLPAFWIQESNNQKTYIKASVVNVTTTDKSTTLTLIFADLATGSLVVKQEEWGISILDLQVKWTAEIPRIIELLFGTSSIPEGRQSLMSDSNPVFSSDWEAFGFCIPGAKEGPVQSYFRMWDFGQTDIALGSFAPSMGTPYGAAFPRPVLSLAMGNNNGWMTIGAGSIPNAPMTLKMRSSLGCISLLYREDLWGAGTRERIWENPMHIAFAENVWLAYRQYFNSFPEKDKLSSVHQKAIWNTWGNWRHQKYPIRPMGDFAKKVGAEIFVIDDPWEASQGLGRPDTIKFPELQDDLESIHQYGMTHGIWETLGWIGDTVACGLTKADLICDIKGNPCIGSWNFNPFAPGYFCIDISSERSRKFLIDRTIRTMKEMKPKLIKLDFGYGMPNPNLGVPRNPEIRGERYTFELLKLIVEAAKSIDPDVTIMYYGINPLYLPLADIISLDDQGDIWYETKAGHAQWSIWASLLCDKQVAISGSSSYDWFTDDEVILNSFILGSPGAVLGTTLNDGSPVPDKYLNRRLAVNTWYRKSIVWNPVWLNSTVVNMQTAPELNCWGRTEKLNGKDQLTALVLRGEKDNSLIEINSFEWKGRWAIISQDEHGIADASKIALVPFDEGFISIRLQERPQSIEHLNINGSVNFTDWKWENNKLIIRVDVNLLAKSAGFLINMKQK